MDATAQACGSGQACLPLLGEEPPRGWVFRRGHRARRAPRGAAERSWRAPSSPKGFGSGRPGTPSSAAIRKVLEEVKTLDRQETHTLPEHKTHSALRQPELRGRCLPLPPPRTRPEGAEPDGRICRICGSGRNRLQASWPGGQGPEFNSRRNRGRSTKSRSDARDLLLQARLGFSRGCAVLPMRPRTPLHSFLHRSPKTLASKPHKAQTTPEIPRALGSHLHLGLASPPCRFLPARHRAARFHGESDANHQKMLREEPPYARPVTETKAQGGGRWKRRREEGLARGWGERREGAGEEGRGGERRRGQGPAPAPRSRSLTCPGRCRC